MYSTGGSLLVLDELVALVTATYTNWDKGSPGDPDCTLMFRWGTSEAGIHALSEYATGVTFDQSFSDGAMTWTVTLSLDLTAGGQAVSGTIEALGSDFNSILSGCNGTFPTLMLHGGVRP